MRKVLVHFLSFGLVCLMSVSTLHGQEICDNGIDDNADGLIDLNDTIACACDSTPINLDIPSLIPNHSFEDYSCCPTQLSEMYCLEDWQQASWATTDFMHNCGFIFDPVQEAGLLPFPDGDGITGAYFAGPNDYNEYVGACLIQPLLQDTNYQLTFNIAMTSSTTNGVYCEGIVFDESIEVVLFGHASCGVLPWSGLTCPLDSGTGWEEIGSVSYETGQEWSTLTINFTPNQDIATIALGSACTQPEPVTECNPYAVFDNLLLNESALFTSLYTITESGSTCDSSLVINAGNTPDQADLQWFLNGIALVGETGPILDIGDNGYGTGTYSLRITTANSCELVEYTVESSVIEASFSSNLECQGAESLFTNQTISDLPYTSSWDFGDGSPVENGDDAGHTYSAAGIYDVVLTVTAVDCQSTFTSEIQIFSAPEVTLNSDPVCSGDDIFIYLETNSDSLSYQWTGPDGFTSTSADVYIANSGTENAGSYTLIVTDSSGCSTEAEIEIPIYESVEVQNDYTVCTGDSLLLPDGTYTSSTGTYSVALQTSDTGCDSTVITEVTVSPDYFISREESICGNQTFELPDGSQAIESGVYIVELSTEAGCDSILEIQLTVAPMPVLSVDADPQYCFDSGVIPLNPTPAGGNLQGDNVAGMTLNLAGADPGEYSYSYNYSSEEGCVDTFEGTYKITSPIFPDFHVTSNCNTATFENLTHDPQGNFSYEWELNDEIVSTDYSVQYPIENPIEAEIVLTVSDEFDCFYSVAQWATLDPVLDMSTFSIPNIISPNGDGVNDVLKIGTEETECLEYKLVISDRWGNKIYEQTHQSVLFSGRSVTGALLSEGVYFYYFESPYIDCSDPKFAHHCAGSLTIVR